MVRKKTAVLVSLATVAMAVALYAAWAHHRAETDREQTELGYAARFADYARDIKPGTTRSDVQGMLESRGISFFQRSGDRTYDTLIPLGREPSGVWYCGPVLASVLISYEPGDGDNSVAEPADVIHSVTLDHWADNCL